MAAPYVPGVDPEEDARRAAAGGFDMKQALASAVPMDATTSASVPVSPLPVGQMRANLDRAQGLPVTQTMTPTAPSQVETAPPMPGAAGVPQYTIADPVNKLSSTATTSTSKSIGTKAEKAATEERVKAIQAEAEASRKVAAAEAEKLRIEAEGEDEKTTIIAAQRAKQLAQDEAADKKIAALESDFEARKNDYAKAKPTEYLNGGGGNKLMAAIGVALGQYASALGGGPNVALQIVNKQIDDHRAKEADRIARMKDDVVMARTGIADAKEARAALWRDNDAKAAAAAEDTLQKYSARKLRAGADAESLKGDKFAAGILDKIGAIKEEAAIRDRTQVNSSKTSNSVTQDKGMVPQIGGVSGSLAGQVASLPLDNQQRDAASRTLTMLDDLAIIKGGKPLSPESLASAKGTEATSRVIEGLPLVGKAIDAGLKKTGLRSGNPLEDMTPEEQRVHTAWTRMNATIRSIYSGSGFGIQEAEEYARMITPQLGDDPATIKLKAARAEEFIRNNAVKAGPAAPLLMNAASLPAQDGTRQQLGQMSAQGKATPAPRMSTQQIAGAQKWLQENPNDPDAPAVRAKLRATLGGS